MPEGIESSQQAPETTNEELIPEIFDELVARYTNEFSQVADERKVTKAVIIFIDPEHPQTPIVHGRGHLLDQAELIAAVLRGMQKEIASRITT